MAEPRPRSVAAIAGWIALVGALLLVVGWPLARLLSEGLGADPARLLEALGAEGAEAIRNSLWVAAAVTALAVAGALAAALLTERSAVPGRGWLRLAIVLPLLIPDFVAAISWGRAYGPGGLTDLIAGVTLPGLYGPLGVVLLLATGSLPLAYLVIVAGLRIRAEPDLERAARAGGAGPWTAFATVTLPLLAPVLAAAGSLVFVTTMNAFAVPVVLGRPAGFATMTTRIYQDLTFSADPVAFERVLALAALLVVVAVVLVAMADRIVPGGSSRTLSPPGPSVGAARGGSWSAALAWTLVVLVVALPLLALALTALTRAVGLPPAPEHWTLDNFAAAIDRRTLPALLNSLTLASLAAVAAVLLGALVAALAWRGRRRWPGTLVALTFALPGSALAVAVLLAFGATLRDTLVLILVAYVAKLWALGHRPIAGALDRLPVHLYHAARASGAGGVAAVRTVVVPIMAPALAAAGVLVFLFALHEVTISILLYGPATATLAVVIVNLQQLGDPTVTSALAVMLTLLVAAAGLLLLLLRRLAGWSGRAP